MTIGNVALKLPPMGLTAGIVAAALAAALQVCVAVPLLPTQEYPTPVPTVRVSALTGISMLHEHGSVEWWCDDDYCYRVDRTMGLDFRRCLYGIDVVEVDGEAVIRPVEDEDENCPPPGGWDPPEVTCDRVEHTRLIADAEYPSSVINELIAAGESTTCGYTRMPDR